MISTQSYTIELFINNDKNNDTPRHTISADSVVSLDITESVLTLLPKISLVFNDKANVIDRYPILDKDVLHLRLNISEDLPETDIVSKFIISTFSITSRVENQGTTVNLSGYLAGDDIFAPYKFDALNGSSDKIIRTISKNMGFKFNSNTSGSESVYWYQHSNNYTFLHQVAKKSYIASDSVYVYGDLTGTINYMSFKTVAALDDKFTAKYDVLKMQEEFILDEDINILYYDGYEILSTNEVYNNISNYGGMFSYYNMRTYESEHLHAMYKNTDLLDRIETYNNTSIFNLFMGVISDKSLQNSIYRAEIQNSVGRYNLFSNSIYLNIRNTSVVKLFDKIYLQLESPVNATEISEPYSGEYFITSISHSIVKDGNPGYSKRILVCRNGINKSDVKQELDGVV